MLCCNILRTLTWWVISHLWHIITYILLSPFLVPGILPCVFLIFKMIPISTTIVTHITTTLIISSVLEILCNAHQCISNTVNQESYQISLLFLGSSNIHFPYIEHNDACVIWSKMAGISDVIHIINRQLLHWLLIAVTILRMKTEKIISLI